MTLVLGTISDDFLLGSGINASIHGDSGNDTLAGGHGNDTLSGGFGSDKLYGGEGNDSLESINYAGSGGSDVLTGGPGNDLFNIGFYDGASYHDRIEIKDFSSEDRINFSSSEQLYQVHVGAGGGETSLTFLYNESDDLVATIAGTELFFLP